MSLSSLLAAETIKHNKENACLAFVPFPLGTQIKTVDKDLIVELHE